MNTKCHKHTQHQSRILKFIQAHHTWHTRKQSIKRSMEICENNNNKRRQRWWRTRRRDKNKEEEVTKRKKSGKFHFPHFILRFMCRAWWWQGAKSRFLGMIFHVLTGDMVVFSIAITSYHFLIHGVCVCVSMLLLILLLSLSLFLLLLLFWECVRACLYEKSR